MTENRETKVILWLNADILDEYTVWSIRSMIIFLRRNGHGVTDQRIIVPLPRFTGIVSNPSTNDMPIFCGLSEDLIHRIHKA